MPALHPRLQELLAAQFANDAAESIESGLQLLFAATP